MDCGPACICMIAKFYGKNFSMDSLRDSCHISKEGVSLLGINETAESLGFKTLGGRFSYDKLTKEIPLPCIIHWKQEHFVVLYKVKRNFNKVNLYIADPGKGFINYTENEFKENWVSTRVSDEDKGIALLLEPTVNFYQQKSEKLRRNSIKFLFSYFFRYKRYFSQIILGLILGSLFQLVFPFLTQSIVDIGIKNQNISFIYLVLLAQLVLMISRMSVDFIRRWIFLHISTRINLSLVSDFLIKLMCLPMNFFDTKLIGDLLQRIDDHHRVERFLTAQSLSVLFSIFTFIVFGIVLSIYSLKILAIFLITSFLYTCWILFFLKRRRQIDYKFFEQRAINQSKTYQLINGMQEIKLQNCEQRMRWGWEDVQADLFKINIS